VVGHGGDDVGHSTTGYSEKIRKTQVTNFGSLGEETQALHLTWVTLMQVPA